MKGGINATCLEISSMIYRYENLYSIECRGKEKFYVRPLRCIYCVSFILICCVTWEEDQFYRCFYLLGKFASNMRFCLKLKIANYHVKLKNYVSNRLFLRNNVIYKVKIVIENILLARRQ